MPENDAKIASGNGDPATTCGSSSAPGCSTNPIDRTESFGMEEIIEWAAWVDHTEGTEASAPEKAIVIAHAILEASCAYESNTQAEGRP